MVENNYSISLIHYLTKDPREEAKQLHCLPVLSIEEDNGKWYFKDCLGNKALTSKSTIHDFVFCGKRIKVFGSVYFYPTYYPQFKPPSRELNTLKKKLL